MPQLCPGAERIPIPVKPPSGTREAGKRPRTKEKEGTGPPRVCPEDGPRAFFGRGVRCAHQRVREPQGVTERTEQDRGPREKSASGARLLEQQHTPQPTVLLQREGDKGPVVTEDAALP